MKKRMPADAGRSGLSSCIKKLVVIQSEAKNLDYINDDAFEILPPFGRLNDIL